MKKNLYTYHILGLVALLLVYPSVISAIVDDTTPYYMQEVLGRVSPQTAGLIKFSTAEANLFNGSMSLDVPLYTINDPDFEIAISLHYQSDGFKPRQHTEYCGLNWTLMAGGCVTRKVQDVPDEYYRYCLIDTRDYGYYYEESAGYLHNQYTNDTTAIMTGEVPWLQGVYHFDYLPDLYTFNFCGYSGTFTLDNAHNVQIISGDFVDIDLSEFSIPHSEYFVDSALYRIRPATQTITITTQTGYKYTFGGCQHAIEYSINMEAYIVLPTTSILRNHPGDTPPANSWYLTKITAPNGRQMVFEYKENEYLWMYDEFYVLPELRNTFTPNGNYSATVTRQVVLSKIKITDEDFEVKFNYDLLNDHLYSSCINVCQGVEPSINSIKIAQLASLEVTHNNHILGGANFQYRTFHSIQQEKESYRYLLSSIHLNGIGTYNYDYNTSTYAPALGHPSTSYYSDENVDYDGYVAGESIKWGAINKVTYPTGGYQTFDYDTAHYFETEEYYYFQDFARAQFTHTYISRTPNINHHRGLRLKKTDKFDEGDQLIESTTYQYEQGVYYDNKEHCDDVEYHHLRQLGWQYNPTARIGYGKVSEITAYYREEEILPMRSKVVYEFEKANPHLADAQNLVLASPGDLNTFGLSGLVFSKSELASKIGKLKTKTIYNITNGTEKIQRKERFSWSGDTDRSNTARVKIAVVEKSPANVARRLWITPVRLSTHSVIDYSDYSSFSNSKSYIYDIKNRVTEINITDNMNNSPRELFEKYIYPDDICPRNSFTSYSDGIQYLVATNQIGTPISTLSGYEKMNQGMRKYITSGQFLYPQLTHPQGVWTMTNSIYKLHLEEPLLENNYIPLTRLGYNSLNYDSHYQLSDTYSQNSKLQITSSQPIGELTTYYTWSGNYLASSQVGDMVTQYQYIPYIGIGHITDPRGWTTYYSYDSAGRVIEQYQMVNGQKQIIKSYNYHYSNQ